MIPEIFQGCYHIPPFTGFLENHGLKSAGTCGESNSSQEGKFNWPALTVGPASSSPFSWAALMEVPPMELPEVALRRHPSTLPVCGFFGTAVRVPTHQIPEVPETSAKHLDSNSPMSLQQLKQLPILR